jgi:hypothetical protein
MRPAQTFFALALLVTVAVPASAQSAEAPPAIKALLTNLERQTAIKPAFDALTDDGKGNVTITNLTFAKPGSSGASGVSVKVADVTFSGITEESPALYKVGKADFTTVTFEVNGQGGFTATMPQAAVEGWYIRTLGENPTALDHLLATSTFASKMSSGKISIIAQGQTITVDGADSSWEGDPKTGAGISNVKISNIAIPEPVLAMLDPGGMLKQLGYTSLNLDVVNTGDMKVDGDKVSYRFDVGLSGRNMASLNVAAAFSDIPFAVYAELLKSNSEGREPNFTALMPQIQSIAFNTASLRFEDASIVSKVLPLAAAMQGMDEKTLKASIGPIVQAALIQFQNEAFTKQATDAVAAFLEAPKSLTIAAKPVAAVKFSDISAMDPNKPGEAITKLGIAVTAND